jgi:hypothetical protein
MRQVITSRTTAALTAALLVLTACTGEEPGSDDLAAEESIDTSPSDAGISEKWTVLTYQLADNDLEESTLVDLEEMMEVGSQDGLDLVTLIDRSEDHYDGPAAGMDDFTTAKLLHVQPDDLVEVEDLGEIDMGDPATLAEFIRRGVTEFPADRYALVVGDHGGGWTGIGPDDDSGGNVIDLEGLHTALSSGLEAAGLERLDLLGFDACLMATYEVATTMAPFARYLASSQELEPGHGWDYRTFGLLADDPATTPEALGRALLRDYLAHAEDEGQSADVTLSLLDLDAMPALDEAMAELSSQLASQAEAIAPVIGVQRASALEYGRSPNPADNTHLADLGTLVSSIGVASLQVSDAADAVSRALGDVVLDKVAGPLRTPSSGLSIYFPPTPQYLDDAYTGVPGTSSWAPFLLAYHGVGQAIAQPEAPAAASAGGTATLTLVEDGLEVTGALDPATVANVVEATLYYGYEDDDGSIVVLGDEPAEVDGDGAAYGFTDLTRMTISDGEDTIPAYLSLTYDEDSGLATADVPLYYVAPDTDEARDILLSIVFDMDTGDVQQETYYAVGAAGTYGELHADPEGLLVPQVLVYDTEGNPEWVQLGEDGVYAAPEDLTYDLVPFEPGTVVYADVTVTDFGGNSAFVSGTTTLG